MNTPLRLLSASIAACLTLTTVVIGGIIAENALTLFVLPAIYSLLGSRRTQ